MIAHNPERNTGLLDGGHEVKERTRRKVSLAFVEIRHRAAIDAAASVRQLSLRMPRLCRADLAPVQASQRWMVSATFAYLLPRDSESTNSVGQRAQGNAGPPIVKPHLSAHSPMLQPRWQPRRSMAAPDG